MDIVINPQATEPIYAQIYTQISSQIINGSLPPGTKLPGIRQISNDLRISVIPVKMAWEELDKDGFITTITGSGTFVKDFHPQEIQEKLNQKIQDFILRTCKEAKDLDLDIEKLTKLLKENY